MIKVSNEGNLIGKPAKEEFVHEVIQKYKELFERRERIIIKLFAEQLINVGQIHLALTPLRKVVRKFIQEDYMIDSLRKNFDDKEIKYLNFLRSFGYLRVEGKSLTLDNEAIKKLNENIKENGKAEKVHLIVSSIFAEHFAYIIGELNNSSIVPFIGILTTLCNLLLELNTNINLTLNGLYNLYMEHYMSGQNIASFEDKIVDMSDAKLIEYDDKKRFIHLSDKLFSQIITKFKLEYTQKQII